MKLVLAEKPSVAQSIAKVLGAAKREDGYLEGNGYVVSWCVGHLVELAQPEVYDAKYSKWAYALPFSFASPPNRTQKTYSVLEDFTLYLYAFCISSECTFPVLFS